jgi:hypothetical protein
MRTTDIGKEAAISATFTIPHENQEWESRMSEVVPVLQPDEKSFDWVAMKPDTI